MHAAFFVILEGSVRAILFTPRLCCRCAIATIGYYEMAFSSPAGIALICTAKHATARMLALATHASAARVAACALRGGGVAPWERTIRAPLWRVRAFQRLYLVSFHAARCCQRRGGSYARRHRASPLLLLISHIQLPAAGAVNSAAGAHVRALLGLGSCISFLVPRTHVYGGGLSADDFRSGALMPYDIGCISLFRAFSLARRQPSSCRGAAGTFVRRTTHFLSFGC